MYKLQNNILKSILNSLSFLYLPKTNIFNSKTHNNSKYSQTNLCFGLLDFGKLKLWGILCLTKL